MAYASPYLAVCAGPAPLVGLVAAFAGGALASFDLQPKTTIVISNKATAVIALFIFLSQATESMVV